MQPATTQKKKINPRDFLTEEILMAGSTAKMAELVAKEIYNIRESKKCPGTRTGRQHAQRWGATEDYACQPGKTRGCHDRNVLGYLE